MKLSKPQQDVINKMTPGKWLFSKDIQARLSTMWALESRSLVELHDSPPTTSDGTLRGLFLWRITDDGIEARDGE